MQASQPNKVTIIGIGEDGVQSLSESASRQLSAAELIIGAPRLLAHLPPGPAERFAIGADLGEVVRLIEQARPHRRIVVLAGGDPLFYGVARYLCDRLGKELFDVVPHVSSMQLAFARVKESWDDAYLTSAANHALEDLVDRVRTAERVGLFTSEELTPASVAKALLSEGIDYFRAYVCENLGARNEVVTQGSLAQIADMTFGPLNVMILVRKPDVPDQPRRTGRRQRFGNPDELFRQTRPKRGLLTPVEVRSLALAQLNLRDDSVVWDVGAGSGSVAIEAAQLAPNGAVFAIEQDPSDCELIKDNALAFGVTNVTIVPARAPEAFRDLPAPDAVFMGGVGRETVGILSEAFSRLQPGGTLVANLASLENVSAAANNLKRLAPHVGVLMVNLARGVQQLENLRFEAVNPSFLVRAAKRGDA